MPIDESALAGVRDILAADDYHLTVTETGSGVEVRITAGPDACDDCLVPKPLMGSMLEPALGVTADQLTLVYPGDG